MNTQALPYTYILFSIRVCFEHLYVTFVTHASLHFQSDRENRNCIDILIHFVVVFTAFHTCERQNRITNRRLSGNMSLFSAAYLCANKHDPMIFDPLLAPVQSIRISY